PVSMTCVRVPVRVGHSASMLVETERPLSAADARAALAAFPGVVVVDDPRENVFPTPQDAAGRDEVLVGRIRKDLGSDRLWLWQVSDNLRKGAATNAVQIAEEMIRRGLK
ncbi:MAG TPA: Asd/ArgC dimerization domain-containing protein, partial [Myxococcota bacterium]|nr:Asd/ArgC dimerization domain-containing protein [Myxococcota bacterium]